VKTTLRTALFSALALIAVFMLAMSGVSTAVVAQNPTETPVPPTATPLPEGAASEEGTLSIWINAERAPILEAAAADFKAQYGIDVNITTMGFGDVRNNFVIAGPAGEGPDIILGAHDWIGQLYTGGLLAPIELPESTAANFDPLALGLFTYNGELVGIPYQVEAIAVYYNKDLVSEVPATWEETVALAQQLVAEGKAERGIAIPPDPYHTFPLISGYGGGVFARDADGAYDPSQVLLDNEGSIAGATELDRLVKEGVFADGFGYDQARSAFQEGKLAMWVTGPWELGNMRSSGVNYGVAAIPAMTQAAAPFIGGQGFMLSRYSKNAVLAQAFLTEFIATDDVQNALFTAAPAVSAWLPTRAANPDADLDAFAGSIANGQPMPTIPQMSAFWSTFGNAVTLIYQQKGAPADIMREAAEAARAEIAKSN
jgi:maltose/maltodextrin transport system substrate-binding protein/arabinogalactan oligomer/maltooligosaccharide transport system substrate-binding protein